MCSSDLTKTNYGIFISSIDLWFSSKPASTTVLYPIELRIVTVENGIPTQKVIASTTLLWNDVKTTSTPSATNGTNTNFRFKDPVYLSPSTEYAFVVLSESPAYKIWYSSLGETDISSQTRIDQQPYAGPMFRSQNGST